MGGVSSLCLLLVGHRSYCWSWVSYLSCLLSNLHSLISIPDEYWANHPELHDIPIYYASSLAKKCMAGLNYLIVGLHFYNNHCFVVYQTFIGAMNERIRRQISISNPFIFKHISNLKVHHYQFNPIVITCCLVLLEHWTVWWYWSLCDNGQSRNDAGDGSEPVCSD